MALHKPRVVYWNNIPSPYVVERFNAVIRRGTIDFEAWFNEEREPDRSWEVNTDDWLFPARYIPERQFLGQMMHLPLAELRETRPDLFVSLYYQPAYAIGSVGARALASRLTYRVLPNYDTWSERTWWRELSKHFLFRIVDGSKVPGVDGAALTRKYGLPLDRAYRVTQSINVAHYRKARDVSQKARKERRRQLGLKGCVFVYAGRLWSGKGLDYLLDAFRTVHVKQPDITLLLIGDGQDESRYREQARTIPEIVFAGFVQARDMPTYYALADVLVFPTLGDPHGLVIEEAMAAGLPVICSENAGDIRRRLPDGKVGYVVPPADAAALADRMLRLASDPALRAQFAAETLALVAEQDHEAYARDFEAFVYSILSLPGRRTGPALLARGLGLLLTAGERGQPSAPYLPRRDADAV